MLTVWVIGDPPPWRKEPKKEEPSVPAEVGATTVPTDINVWGNTAGHAPQPPPTTSDAPPEGPLSVSEGGLVVAETLGEIAVDIGRSLVLNALTFGGYGTYQMGRAMWAGYLEDGFLGALNSMNPLYWIGRGAADTQMAVERGDPRAAIRSGVKTAVLGVAAGVGIAQGVGALSARAGAARGTAMAAEGSAAGAPSGGASSSAFVYQLVDDLGEPVYYGITKHPTVRLGQHARKPEGPFRGMQVISDALPLPQARALETSLIQQAHAEGRFIYNRAGASISPTAPISVPSTIRPTETMLNPKIYPR
jgi:hypothetical protein